MGKLGVFYNVKDLSMERKELSAEEAEVYDRQLRMWGVAAQHRYTR